MTTLPRLTIALAALLAASPALAQQQGDWTMGLGFHQVNPKSDNGSLAGGTLPVSIGSNQRPTITLEYFIRDNIGIELLAALPFQHDVDIDGLGKVGSVRHLPPVLSVQYHVPTGTALTPFFGVGVNYTHFYGESTTGALRGSELKLKDSWGLALHAGLDWQVSERGAIRADLRWIDIDSDVTLDRQRMGSVAVDPLVYGVAYVWRF